ncbi:hypothetical protein AGMMS4957_08950 [Bacteroidia bacterium]|nr:hypothetical protein AGMMS4957_08950 [Bacteroidia bacterium]
MIQKIANRSEIRKGEFNIIAIIVLVTITLFGCKEDIETENDIFIPPTTLTQEEIEEIIEEAKILFLKERQITEKTTLTDKGYLTITTVNVDEKKYLQSFYLNGKLSSFRYEDDYDWYEYESDGIDWNGDGIAGNRKGKNLTNTERYWTWKMRYNFTDYPYSWKVAGNSLVGTYHAETTSGAETGIILKISLYENKKIKRVVDDYWYKYGSNQVGYPGVNSYVSQSDFTYTANPTRPQEIDKFEFENHPSTQYYIKIVWGEDKGENLFWMYNVQNGSGSIDYGTIAAYAPSTGKEIEGIYSDPLFTNKLDYEIHITEADNGKVLYVKWR